MILVDSSVWIDYFRGAISPETNRLDILLGQELIATGDLVLTEVLQGFQADKDFNQAKRLLSSLVMVDLVGHDNAVQSAKNYRKLRAKGVTVRKTIDCLIATHCIEHGTPLLYSDKDFDPFVERLGLVTVADRFVS